MSEIGFLEILRPAAIVFRVLRITPYRYDLNTKQYTISTSRVIQGVIIMGIVVIYTLINVDHYTLLYDKDFSKASTIKILLAVRIIANISNTILNFIMCMKNTKYFSEISEYFGKIDKELVDFGQGEEIFKSNRKMRRLCVTWVILLNGFVDVVLEIAVQYLCVSSYNIIDTIVLIYPLLNLDSLQIMFFVLLRMHEERFRILNNLIAKMVEDSNCQLSTYPDNSEEFCRNIKKYVAIHKQLVKGSRKINEIFSLQLLLIITSGFILLIGDLHTATYIILFNLFWKQYKIFIILMKGSIITLCLLQYNATRCMRLSHRANATKNLILGIKIGIEMEEARNTVIASTLKLMQNKLEITACKLFSIDNALLFSICAAASSYLFIMLQLDLGNSESGTSVPNRPLNGSPPQ